LGEKKPAKELTKEERRKAELEEKRQALIRIGLDPDQEGFADVNALYPQDVPQGMD
jgi:hypothetical protein